MLSLDTEAHVNFLQGEPPELIQNLLIISWHINFKTFFICTRMYLYACVSICEARRSSMVSMFLSHASYFFETRFLTKPGACQPVDCQPAALQIPSPPGLGLQCPLLGRVPCFYHGYWRSKSCLLSMSLPIESSPHPIIEFSAFLFSTFFSQAPLDHPDHN